MPHNPTTFGGASKVGESLFHRPEQWTLSRMVQLVPTWIHSYHLTLSSIPISLLIILGGFLARDNVAWLWMNSGLVVLHWATDGLDGAIGRKRNEGLVYWGYYMDHLLDYIFLAAVLTSYTLFLNGRYIYEQFFILGIFTAFMINSYLSLAVTNEFRIAYFKIGPTEIRVGFIIINLLYIFLGQTYLSAFIPYLLIFALLGLCVVVFRSQRYIWRIDMVNKAKKVSRFYHPTLE